MKIATVNGPRPPPGKDGAVGRMRQKVSALSKPRMGTRAVQGRKQEDAGPYEWPDHEYCRLQNGGNP